MVARRTQAERSRATRTALLAAARKLFAEQGFARTGREQIAEEAGVTRGALYHHFSTKEDLFRAVVEELEADVAESVLRAADGSADPAALLRRGAQAFLDACLDPAVQRIVLLDAPSVLGQEVWRDIDERHGLGLVTAGLEAAMDAGLMVRRPVAPLAHLLLGALHEAGMVLATAKRPKAARREVGEAIDWLLDRLLV